MNRTDRRPPAVGEGPVDKEFQVQLASLNRARRSARTPRGLLGRCALAAALAGLCGCSGFEKPRYEVGDRKILMIPFRDFAARNMTGYGESPRGRRVLEEFRNYTEKTFVL